MDNGELSHILNLPREVSSKNQLRSGDMDSMNDQDWFGASRMKRRGKSRHEQMNNIGKPILEGSEN